MKVEQIEPKPQFRPVVITLESQEEVDAITTIVCHARITEIFPVLKGWWIKLDNFGGGNDKKWWELDNIIK